MTAFVEFPKIARLSRGMVVTEKLDGTNAQVLIAPTVQPAEVNGVLYEAAIGYDPRAVWHDAQFQILAGSRSRWITPDDDNFGFARWVHEHAQELLKLGPGSHFGEWWGSGIQRRYGLTEKRFSLFNVARWSDDAARPACCHVVPTLYTGPFDTDEIASCVESLRANGSVAAPGFMKPEGVIVWHEAARVMFKKTLDKDDEHKGKAVA